MTRHGMLRGGLVCGLLLGLPMLAFGAPPHSTGHGSSATRVQAQLKDVDDRLAAAHAHNMALQSEVTDLERQNGARKQQLQQRDEQIAALQKQLAAAGVPASAATAGQ